MLCDGIGSALLPTAVAVAKQLHVLRVECKCGVGGEA